MKDIPIKNSIVHFMHCGMCINELPSGKSPREYGELEMGFTKLGLQVWCKRHEANVIHIDFEGQKHPANLGIYTENVQEIKPEEAK